MKLLICVLSVCALAAAQDFKECLEKDSISCLQLTVRKTKSVQHNVNGRRSELENRPVLLETNVPGTVCTVARCQRNGCVFCWCAGKAQQMCEQGLTNDR